ncbi:MAG TPA: NAD-dependent epimerase/dehydratase family protein [Acidobacteriota bacterium]|nr:NAD-dependent epimerase/dehydratase family protein [Acidobacteriota bacterium]
MRIVIIGGTGFIGSRLAAQLADHGHELLSVQRRISAALPQSIRQLACDHQELHAVSSQLRGFRPDVVIDVISSSAGQARSTVEVCAGYTGRIVSVSSQDVYKAFGIFHGTEEGGIEPVPLTEDSPRRSRRDTYPRELLVRLRKERSWVTEEYSNAEMEDVVMNAAAQPSTVLRLPMVYGPGDYIHRLYPILKRIDDGRQVIPIADLVAQWRSPRGYVDNVAAAIALAAESTAAAGQVFNVAEPESFSEQEWTKLVADAAGWNGSITVIPFDRAPAHLRLPGNFAQHGASSSSRIRELLGYREIIDRGEALLRTIAWERAHPPDPLPKFDYVAEEASVSEIQGGPTRLPILE